MLIFGIAFGKPPVAFLKIWGSFQGAFWDYFGYFLEKLQNSKNATFLSEMLDLESVGPPCLHLFCLLFEGVFRVAF